MADGATTGSPTMTTTERASANAKRCSEEQREFEYCEVCKRNHDQGRRHRYFPAHARALSALLARFHRKLSDLRFFLRNPSPLRPEYASLNRLWCIFCSCDISEIGSPFACNNAIKHLASSEHLRSLKDFLWKHGGGVDRVDSFRVSEVDLLKWESGCETVNNAATSSCDKPIGPLPCSSKNIQHAPTYKNVDNFEENSIHSFISNISHSVMPLQNLTNEDYGEHHPDVTYFQTGGSIQHPATSWLMDMQGSACFNGTHVFGNVSRNLPDRKLTCIASNVEKSIGWSPGNATVQRNDSSGNSNEVFQNLTAISMPSEVCQANVHTGAPPPWLEIKEEKDKFITNKNLNMNMLAVQSFNSKNSRKLNPKRVGASWAEKRRAELEMEKRGIVPETSDTNWLPNFGRVWQAGTRKQSRKEFEMEKNNLPDSQKHFELSSKIQPYISKRMRIGCSDAVEAKGHVEENSATKL